MTNDDKSTALDGTVHSVLRTSLELYVNRDGPLIA